MRLQAEFNRAIKLTEFQFHIASDGRGDAAGGHLERWIAAPASPLTMMKWNESTIIFDCISVAPAKAGVPLLAQSRNREEQAGSPRPRG